MAIFNGKFDILHVFIMGFQKLRYLHKLFINRWQIFLQTGNRLGSPNTCHHIFALSINQIFAVQSLFPSGGIARKGYTSTAGIAHIAKDHGLDINRCTQMIGDLIDLPVDDGPWILPGAKHGLDSQHQLFFRILRKILAPLSANQLFILCNNFAQAISAKLIVIGYILSAFFTLQDIIELKMLNFHNHVAIHLNKAAITIQGKPFILRAVDQPFNGLIIEAQIEHSIHHAWHGNDCTRTYGYQQRVLGVAKRFTSRLLDIGQLRPNLFQYFR